MFAQRSLNGDNIVVNDDWSARAAGTPYVFRAVRDGRPTKPWISDKPGPMSARSILLRVPTDRSGHKERMEWKIARAIDADGLHFDNAKFSAFSFLIAPPVAPFLGSAIIYQCWQGYPFGPPVSLKIVGGLRPPFKLKLAIRNMATGPWSTTPDTEVWSEAMLEPDTWYNVVVYVQPRIHSDGRLRLWINGDEKVNWSGRIGYDPRHVSGSINGLDVKNGIYQPSPNNGHRFYFDGMSFGDDFPAGVR